MTEADCQAAAPACTAAAIDHVCRGQPLAVNQRPAIGGQPDDIAATATEERLDDDPEYQWKQYVETHKVPPATDIADYDLLVTHSFHDYVYDNAQRTHMWLYAVQEAKDALVCLINEMSRIKVAAVDTYFERRHMAEQIFDDIICGDYCDDQRYQVFLQDLPVKSIFAGYASDPCHAAAKERIVIHVLAVHMLKQNYLQPRWLRHCCLCRFLNKHKADFEEKMKTNHSAYVEDAIADVAGVNVEKNIRHKKQRQQNQAFHWLVGSSVVFLNKEELGLLSISCYRSHELIKKWGQTGTYHEPMNISGMD